MTVVTATAGALGEVDPEVASAISNEEERLRTSLEMIASENYASDAVREAVGSVLTNKYAEGYPGKRYYAGNRYVDDVETLAIDRGGRRCSASTTPTCSRTPERRRTWRCTRAC